MIDAANFATLTDTFIFNYTVGSQMPLTNARATYADTNMPAAGQLPMGHQMLVYSLQVIPDEFASSTTPTDLTPEWNTTTAFWKWRHIFFETLLHLVVEQTKSFVEGRLDHFPAGGGFILDSNASNDESLGPSAYAIYNGERTWAATRRLAMPVHLGSLENFYILLDWPRNGIGNGQSGYGYTFGFGLLVRMTGPRQRPTG